MKLIGNGVCVRARGMPVCFFPLFLCLCAFFSLYSVLLFPVFGTRCLSDFNVKSGGCLVTYLVLSWKTML